MGDAVVRLRHWLDWDGVLEYFGNNEHAARKVITDVEQMIDGGTIWYLVVIAVFFKLREIMLAMQWQQRRQWHCC